VIREADRITDYIPALERADAGDLRPLINLFANRQKDEILRALSLEQQVKQQGSAETIFASAVQVLNRKAQTASQQQGVVDEFANTLFRIAGQRMQALAQMMRAELAQTSLPENQPPYQVELNTADNQAATRTSYYRQILECSKKQGYVANLNRYHAWLRIAIVSSEHFEIVLSIHGYGPGDTGILSACAFTERRIVPEGGGVDVVDVRQAGAEVFQFNDAEPLESTVARFRHWLEMILATAVGHWQRLMA